MSIIHIGKHALELSNTDKILFPADKITKGDIIDYYQSIVPYMFPLCKNHPISMLRYPNGIEHEGFYQKDTPDYFPAWIKRADLAKEDGTIVHYTVINDPAVIVYLANQGCLIAHLWLSRSNHMNFPDRLIFDLDPTVDNFAEVCAAGLVLKKLLEHLELIPFVMTTGSRGIHVVVPLRQKDSFETVRVFTQSIAQLLENYNPDLLTTQLRIKSRENKIFVDYLRNALSATAVAPYAVRAKNKAPVATPLFWEELTNKKLFSSYYTIKTVHKKLQRDGDPWHDFYCSARTLAKAQKILKTLVV